MILICGATGKTGRQLLNLLKASGIPARAIVRDPAKAAGLRDRGFEVVIGDLGDREVLAGALKNVDHAFLLMANSENQCTVEKQFIDAAQTAGTRHIVKLSAIGADSSSTAVLKRYHGQAEDYLKQSGLVHTIIQPGFFMDNMLNCAQTIARDNSFSLPMGAGKSGVVDIRDVAEVALAALTRPGHENKTWVVTGPEILSFAEIAVIFSAVLGRQISYVDSPPDEFREQLLKWGQSDWYVAAALQLFELNRQNKNAKITGDFEAVTGRAPRSMRQFVQDHLASFN